MRVPFFSKAKQPKVENETDIKSKQNQQQFLKTDNTIRTSPDIVYKDMFYDLHKAGLSRASNTSSSNDSLPQITPRKTKQIPSGDGRMNLVNSGDNASLKKSPSIDSPRMPLKAAGSSRPAHGIDLDGSTSSSIRMDDSNEKLSSKTSEKKMKQLQSLTSSISMEPAQDTSRTVKSPSRLRGSSSGDSLPARERPPSIDNQGVQNARRVFSLSHKGHAPSLSDNHQEDASVTSHTQRRSIVQSTSHGTNQKQNNSDAELHLEKKGSRLDKKIWNHIHQSSADQGGPLSSSLSSDMGARLSQRAQERSRRDSVSSNYSDDGTGNRQNLPALNNRRSSIISDSSSSVSSLLGREPRNEKEADLLLKMAAKRQEYMERQMKGSSSATSLQDSMDQYLNGRTSINKFVKAIDPQHTAPKGSSSKSRQGSANFISTWDSSAADPIPTSAQVLSGAELLSIDKRAFVAITKLGEEETLARRLTQIMDIPSFKQAPEGFCKKILPFCRFQMFETHAPIILEGSHLFQIYWILSGSCRSVKVVPFLKKLVNHTHQNGNVYQTLPYVEGETILGPGDEIVRESLSIHDIPTGAHFPNLPKAAGIDEFENKDFSQRNYITMIRVRERTGQTEVSPVSIIANENVEVMYMSRLEFVEIATRNILIETIRNDYISEASEAEVQAGYIEKRQWELHKKRVSKQIAEGGGTMSNLPH